MRNKTQYTEKVKSLLWRRIIESVEEHRLANKQFIATEGDMPPEIKIYTYCPTCRKINVKIIIAAMDIEDLRENFEIMLKTEFLKEMACGRCCDITIPLGYSFDCLAWEISGSNKEELDLYWRVIGTLEYHPQKTENYISNIVTTLGRKLQISEQIIRRQGKIIFTNRETIEDVKGLFILELPIVKDEVWRNIKIGRR